MVFSTRYHGSNKGKKAGYAAGIREFYNAYEIVVEHPKGGDNLGDQDVDGTIILKQLKRMSTGFISSRIDNTVTWM